MQHFLKLRYCLVKNDIYLLISRYFLEEKDTLLLESRYFLVKMDAIFAGIAMLSLSLHIKSFAIPKKQYIHIADMKVNYSVLLGQFAIWRMQNIEHSRDLAHALGGLLSCQPRVRVTSCFVYKVIRDLESIDHSCINPIRRIGLIHM